MEWSHQIDWIENDGDPDPLINRIVDDITPVESPVRFEAIKRARVAMAHISAAGWIAGLEALRRAGCSERRPSHRRADDGDRR